jgi:iron-sulfur cluster assembly accessory protein
MGISISKIGSLSMTRLGAISLALVCSLQVPPVQAWTLHSPAFRLANPHRQTVLLRAEAEAATATSAAPKDLVKDSAKEADLEYYYVVPEDAVVTIRPRAMRRLQELRQQQKVETLWLRMGVRSGGCSGMSYVMDFAEPESAQEDDSIDKYLDGDVQCVVDAKSLLYLYGLELDYSDALVGGGFRFLNPNAEETCGCGSSFGV